MPGPKLNIWYFNFLNALEAVYANLFRSILTALGIIFGVGAVIAMLAVGSGAKQEVLNQLELVGVNNIVIEPIVEQQSDESDEGENNKKQNKRFSGGLNLEDANAIQKVIPNVKISPEVVYQTHAVRSGIRRKARLVGIRPTYFSVYNLDLSAGRVFNDYQMKSGASVCIIGQSIKSRFFSDGNAIGEKIKLGDIWLEVIGVVEERKVTSTAQNNLGIRDYNLDVYAPVKTVLRRYKNRALITKDMLRGTGGSDDDDEEEDNKGGTSNFNQLDKLVVQAQGGQSLRKVQEVIQRLLKRRHNEVADFEVNVPELLLQQQQETKNLFNVVLGTIAGISLLVGGIGIMNIMLASVMERTKEIGIRQAVGATRKDIIIQFLSESTIISLSGGLIGVFFGVGTAKVITHLTGILTIVTIPSVLLSFFVAAFIGLIFGIFPAKKAAEQDPITSLRHE